MGWMFHSLRHDSMAFGVTLEHTPAFIRVYVTSNIRYTQFRKLSQY